MTPKPYTGNLSPTTESLLADVVKEPEQGQGSHQAMADYCAADWNAVHSVVGDYADDHSPL